ncbi:MAG: amidohydrolase [Candidatus Omnitrophica bacterium]|nr:amidohydrolase [Candidatus Omnitrophota bacterium]
MLADSHIHFIPGELSDHTNFYKGVWADKDKLYQFLDSNNIDRAFLVYPSTDAYLKLGGFKKVSEIYNREVEKILKENPKIVAACLVDVEDLSNISSELAQLKNRGFKAINLASSYNGKFIVDQLFPLFEAVQEHNLPIFVHSQTINPIGYSRVKDPLLMPVLEYSLDLSTFLGLLMMEGVLDKFKVKFILASLGGVVPFLKDRFDRVYTMLRKREMVKDLGRAPSQILKEVYVDTSGSSLGNIKLALDLFGQDHILWGSDYPVNLDLESNLKILDELGEEVKEKITYKNLAGLFE